jgi:hypothetical protein
MSKYFLESGLFLYGTVNHFFLMMYWVWIPALLLSAYFSSRHHSPLRETVFITGRQLLKLLALGVTGSGHPLGVLGDAQTLGAKEPSRLAGAFALTAPHLVVYRLSVIMALVGLEFALGQLLGAVVVGVLLARLGPTVGERKNWRSTSSPATIPAYLGQEGRAAWPLLYGLLLSGLIGAAGRQDWWIDLSEAGGGGVVTALLNAGVGASLAVVSFAPPLANLFIASWLWKAYGLSYAGVIAFVMPPIVRQTRPV